MRNEQTLKVYDEKGRAFEPDFLLFCRPLSDAQCVYQIFIEPKGEPYFGKDKWKEDFLKRLRDKSGSNVLQINTDRYVITGVPFYNSKNENAFDTDLKEVLEI